MMAGACLGRNQKEGPGLAESELGPACCVGTSFPGQLTPGYHARVSSLAG